MDWPVLNNQTEASLHEKAAQLARNFTPEWRFDPAHPDAGTAVLMLFSRMMAGNLRRMNRVPERNYVSYLNLLGIGRIPATPATAYVHFAPVDGVPGPVAIQAGTRLLALPTGEFPDEIPFTTDSVLSVVNATLQVMVVAHGERDTISLIHPGEQGVLSQPLTLLRPDADNLQSHAIYIEHAKLFRAEGTIRVTLLLEREARQRLMPETLGMLADPRRVQWTYYTNDGWQPFDTVRVDENQLILDKQSQGPLLETEVNGHTGMWIRGSVFQGAIHDVIEGIHPLTIDRVDIKTESLTLDHAHGLPPDQVFANDVEVESEGFHPFGTYFNTFNTCYISQSEAFSKPGAEVSLQFTLQCVPTAYGLDNTPDIRWRFIMRESEFKKHVIPELSVHEALYEYWNGRGWVRLDVSPGASTMFSIADERLTQITFVCPDDLEITDVNGHSNYWIRLRIGRMDNNYAAHCIYHSPHLHDLRLHYQYRAHGRAPSHLLAFNNLEWVDVTPVPGSGPSTDPWFVSMGRQGLQLICGIDGVLEGGPVGLYLAGKNPGGKSPFSTVDWTYLDEQNSERIWLGLGTSDDTGRFAKSGVVRFLCPKPVQSLPWLGRKLRWIRCRLWVPDSVDTGWSLERALFNVVACTQRTYVEDEMPSVISSAGTWSATLMHAGILTQSVWVDETGQLSSDELHQLEADSKLDVLRDVNNEIMRVWVVWESVPNFSSSASHHRHYVVDRVSGSLLFGDGQQGRVLPGVDPVIRVSYAHGGGELGNVDKGRINATVTAIPFMNQISNPDPAFGGTDAETWEETLRRGPNRVSHRDRATTAEDWERLALESSSQIARVKCFPNRNQRMGKVPGYVTLTLLTKDRKVDTFLNVRKRLLGRLQASVPSVLTVGDRLQIIPPAFIHIGIHVHLVLERMDDLIHVEGAVRRRLNDYFDIDHGNHHGRGWQIGEQYHHSPLYGYLKSIPGISFIERMDPTIMVDDGQLIRELVLDDLRTVRNGIVVSGTHQLSARIEMRRAGADA